MQGWVLWGLWKARELHAWPSTDTVSERALLYLSLALPLAIYLTEGIAALSARRRKFLLYAIALLFPALGAYSGWVERIPADLVNWGWIPPTRPSDLLAAAMLGFMLVPLVAHFDRKHKNWPYHDLFETAWRNVILCLSAGFLTGVFWLVLFAGSELLHGIGLSFMRELIKKPVFSMPVTGIAFAAAFALSLARAEMVITLRRFQLSLLAWLLPLLMIFIFTWVVALPFTGVALLFKTGNAAFILLWCAALCISFANAAYQDGMTAPPYGRYLSKLLAWSWLGLPLVVGVAAWAMGLRIAQHGWSEDRVWGVFALLMATLYVMGYAASALRPAAWLASIGKTNAWAAVAMCAGLLALLSPIADARRIAVNSQLQRLLDQTVAADQFDFGYLRWEAGHYGQKALHALQSGITHPERDMLASKAGQVLAQTQRHWPAERINTLTVEEIKQRMRILPAGAVLDPALLLTLRAKSHDWILQKCLNPQTQCTVWLVDLNADHLNDAVVWVKHERGDGGSARVLQNRQGKYHIAGSLSWPQALKYDQLLAQIGRGAFKVVQPEWNAIDLSGQRLHVQFDAQEP